MSEVIAPFSPTLSERVTKLLRSTEYRLIHKQEDREDVCRLRYQSYLREMAINPRIDQILTDIYDTKDNNYLFGVYIDGELASSIRLHVLSATSQVSPAAEVFPDIIHPLLETGKKIIDPNRFVADHAMARRHPELPYLTLRLPFLAADYFGVDLVTATVRPEHQAFYRRVLRYVPCCTPRHYPTLIKPLSLMMVNFRAQRGAVLQKYPLFHSLSDEKVPLTYQ